MSMQTISQNTIRLQAKGLGSKQPSLAFAPSLGVRGKTARRAMKVSAIGNKLPEPSPEFIAAAQGFGFTDVEEGIFGFKPFSELFAGRAAMIGFGAGVLNELITKKSILQQLHLCDGTPNTALFVILTLAMGGGTAYAANKTVEDFKTGEMPVKTFENFTKFVGMNNRQTQAAILGYKETQRALGKAEPEEVASTTGESAAAPGASEDAWGYGMSQADELLYAKGVEMQNGRAAMIGFAIAILIESATGEGVMAQFFGYMQGSGILGPGMYETLIAEFTSYQIPM